MSVGLDLALVFVHLFKYSILCVFMAALRSRRGHYIFALCFLSSFFLLSSFFIRRLISAVGD